jgi:hypothetical protein
MRYAVTAVILGAVFAASVLNQLSIRRWDVLVAQYDKWSFLPFWSFFAPNPGYAGTHLVFRDRHAAGWTSWTELELPDTTGWRWLWNPGRFERKALQDLLNGFARAAEELRDPVALEFTTCHVSLLTWVDAQPPLCDGGSHRQFALLQAVGHGEMRTLEPVVVSREYERG